MKSGIAFIVAALAVAPPAGGFAQAAGPPAPAAGRGPCESGDPMPVAPLPAPGPEIPQLAPSAIPAIPIPNLCEGARAGTTVRIRGTAIPGPAEPLYVVDDMVLGSAPAVANPLNDIPPLDIESITVVKDATAVARYGERARNGVVIIRTKPSADSRPR